MNKAPLLFSVWMCTSGPRPLGSLAIIVLRAYVTVHVPRDAKAYQRTRLMATNVTDDPTIVLRILPVGAVLDDPMLIISSAAAVTLSPLLFCTPKLNLKPGSATGRLKFASPLAPSLV